MTDDIKLIIGYHIQKKIFSSHHSNINFWVLRHVTGSPRKVIFKILHFYSLLCIYIFLHKVCTKKSG